MTSAVGAVVGLALLARAAAGPVTKADIEAKLRQVQGQFSGVQQAAEGSRARAAVALGGVVLVLVAYLFGLRRGKRNRAVVEIRRV